VVMPVGGQWGWLLRVPYLQWWCWQGWWWCWRVVPVVVVRVGGVGAATGGVCTIIARCDLWGLVIYIKF
jgi:hypothetical protein